MSYLGEEIPKLGFGCMRFPKLENGATDIEQVKDMVDAFMEAGGTYFDTARAYGSSEADLRQALVERYPRESYYLATKNASWLGAANAEEARAMFDTSLQETGAGYFDFYLIHNVGANRTQVFDDYEMWDFVKKLKADGKVKHIGFSMHDNARVLEEVIDAHPEMEFVQLQVNYADWENGSTQSRKCCEVAAAHGLPIIIMEPVHGGTLANPPQQVVDILKAADPDVSCASWAIRFCLDVPGIITVLSGMSSMEQMQDNLKTWKSHKPLTAQERQVLEQARVKLDELMAVPCTGCRYCMKACPTEMPIDDIMETLNRKALYGQDAGQGAYNLAVLGRTKASECIECGVCEDACPQKIGVIDQLKAAVTAFESEE